MIGIEIERDVDCGVTLVRLDGELNTATFQPIKTAVSKAAAECPAAVIIDLSALRAAGAPMASLFATLTRQAQDVWGVPVLLSCAADGLARDLIAFRHYVARYDSTDHALLAVRAYAPRWMRQHLPPVPGSAREARDLVGDACMIWDLKHLRQEARLVTSELAANAIVHAGTEFDVMASYTRIYLRIAVRDGSTAQPKLTEQPNLSSAIVPPGRGRGMRVVSGASTHWGCTALPHGKIVWALLRATAPADN